MTSPRSLSAPELKDSRLSAEFQQRLARYMGECDPASAFASRWVKWYEEHAGTRSDWFRQDLIWRLEFIHPLAGRSVLDFGCGTGSSSVVIAEKGATVVGVETEQKSIDVAAQRVRDLGVGHRCTFVRIPYLGTRQGALPFQDASFDVCTLIGVLEHMTPSERRTCAAEINRVLKPEGDLFIFDTPNRAYPLDHHTTLLWFIGWMPRFLARRYAILRKRFDPKHDFQRYGGNGLSRNEIDSLFPPCTWRVMYEKSREEVAHEFGWLVRRSTVQRLITGVAYACLKVVMFLGYRPTYWTASHALCLTKQPRVFASAEGRAGALRLINLRTRLVSGIFTVLHALRNWVESNGALSLHWLQLVRLRIDGWRAKMLGHRCLIGTASGHFPIYSQTFVYQELTQLLSNGFALRFLYSKLDSRDYLPSQFSPLWHARRRLILHPAVWKRDYEYFKRKMPQKIDMLVSMLARASGIPPHQVRSHNQFLQAFSFARMVEAYRPEYLHSYFFYEGSLFTFVASYLLDIPRGVSCYADHMLSDYAFKVVPLHLEQCRLVVATSQRIKQELIGIAPQVDAERIIVKPNAINAAHFPVISPEEPDEGRPYRLVSVCRIEPKKGLIYLVEAVRFLRDRDIRIEWHHLGAADGSASGKEYACELRERIKDLKLGGVVNLEGRKSESEIKAFLKRSHVFVAPFIETEYGDKDGIPTSLLEGMASGLPVVGTDAGSIREVIEDDRDGVLVPQRDSLSLANAIEALLCDPNRRRHLGQEAAEKIRRRFDVQVCERIFHEQVRAIIHVRHHP